MAIPDIIGAINQTEPFASASPTLKLRVLHRLAKSFKYRDMVPDAEGNDIPNPESHKDYLNRIIMRELKDRYEKWDTILQAEELTAEPVDFGV